jgi:hypothetical protein
MRAKMTTVVTEHADWMALGALRNNDDALFVWQGDPEQAVAGITFPEEVTRWLNATGLYASVDNQVGSSASALSSKGYNAAERLQVEEGTDILCLIQANIVADQIGAGTETGFLSYFPNHWVILLGQVQQIVGNARVSFPIWSFGQDWEDCQVSDAQTFADNFYGAIVAKMK